jgi:putative pyruvate formate lyase activating enzyme
MKKLCNQCARFCNVNRDENKGFCNAENKIVYHSYLKHFGEEPPISGKNGSGTVFFSGCSLKCVFCQNHQISYKVKGLTVSTDQLSEIFLSLQAENAHNINLVTPTHFSTKIYNSLLKAKKNGLNIPVIYNTSGFDSIETLNLIDEVIDIYIPDFKFITPQLSLKYCNTDKYPKAVKQNIKFMLKKKKNLKIKNGLAVTGVLIRHLVMPNLLKNTFAIIEYLFNEYGPELYLSIMSQYNPVHLADQYPEINRKVSIKEYESVIDFLIKKNFTNVFLQELSSSDEYLPDFDNKNVFVKKNNNRY